MSESTFACLQVCASMFIRIPRHHSSPRVPSDCSAVTVSAMALHFSDTSEPGDGGGIGKHSAKPSSSTSGGVPSIALAEGSGLATT